MQILEPLALHTKQPFDRTAQKLCFGSDTEQLWQACAHHRFALQAFVPYTNASSSNETARYLDSHLVHTGQFFNTNLLNTYVRHLHRSCLCTSRLCSSSWSACNHAHVHCYVRSPDHSTPQAHECCFVGCLWSPFLTHPQLVQMALLGHEDNACAVFPIMVSPLSPLSCCCQQLLPITTAPAPCLSMHA